MIDFVMGWAGIGLVVLGLWSLTQPATRERGSYVTPGVALIAAGLLAIHAYNAASGLGWIG